MARPTSRSPPRPQRSTSSWWPHCVPAPAPTRLPKRPTPRQGRSGSRSMSFSLIPPEINSALMYQGAGSGPLLEAATAWDGLAADLEATATQYQTAVTNLTTGTWLGPSSAHMASAAEPYIGWLQSPAAGATQTGAQAQAAAGAYQTAYASMVPPPVITANRAELTTLVSNNFLGQNTG